MNKFTQQFDVFLDRNGSELLSFLFEMRFFITLNTVKKIVLNYELRVVDNNL